MNKEMYLDMVRAADGGDVLHCLRQDVNADPSLHSTEKDEILTAVQNKFAAINAGNLTEAREENGGPRRTEHRSRRMAIVSRKVLPLILFFAAGLMGNASPERMVPVVNIKARPESAYQQDPAAIFDGLKAATAAVTPRRLQALSMIETGDDDNAIGRAGEVSRYQIKPGVWKEYFRKIKTGWNSAALLRAAATNPFTARNVATAILQDRCRAFAARFHRQPTDREFYLLWNSPGALATRGDGAERFSNLVSSNHQL
jgi:hypothetical protein